MDFVYVRTTVLSLNITIFMHACYKWLVLLRKNTKYQYLIAYIT